MLMEFDDLRKRKIGAKDGEIGKIEDLYFDDREWIVRYIVAETGGWLSGRKVLLSTHVLGRLETAPPDVLPVDLTREQVEKSPDIDTAKPVSRQHEEALSAYYGWPEYWGTTSLGTRRTFGVAPNETTAGDRIAQQGPNWEEGDRPRASGDPDLQAAREVHGYAIEAEDGEIGHVDDLILDTTEWMVRYLVIKTGNWFAGSRILLAPAWIRDVDWGEERVKVALHRQVISESPLYDPKEGVTREYEDRLYSHYRKEKYWS